MYDLIPFDEPLYKSIDPSALQSGTTSSSRDTVSNNTGSWFPHSKGNGEGWGSGMGMVVMGMEVVVVEAPLTR